MRNLAVPTGRLPPTAGDYLAENFAVDPFVWYVFVGIIPYHMSVAGPGRRRPSPGRHKARLCSQHSKISLPVLASCYRRCASIGPPWQLGSPRC